MKIVIKNMYDGFSISLNSTTFYFDQEDPPAEDLAEVFKELGFTDVEFGDDC